MEFLLIYVAFLLFVRYADSDMYEYKLYDYLMKEYDPLERPVGNNSMPVVVKLGVDLQQIIGLDEKNQIFEVNVWLRYTWNDHKLKWNPDEFGGIKDVRFHKGHIWMPDVLLYNSADSNFDATYPSNQVVYSDGTVSWIPPGILKSSCKVDIKWFPFDDQSCFLKFGSWTYNGFALDLRPENEQLGMFTNEYLENGEWSIRSTPVERSVVKYDCCPEPYYDLKFYVNMRRRTLYYGFNMIIPSLLMSLMTLLGFTLPPDACEKITLDITILLSLCVFLSMVASMTPPTSEAVPLIGVFFSVCLFLVSISVVVTVGVINFHFRKSSTNEISPCVRSILLNWLPWLLMMRRPGHKFSRSALAEYMGWETKKKQSESLLRNIRTLECATLPGVPHNDEVLVNVANHRRNSIDLESRINSCLKPYLENQGKVDPGIRGMLVVLQKLHSELKVITQRMEEEDEEETVENDWKFAAMVIDRLCLIIFSVVIVASTGIIMFSAPYISA